MGEDTGKVKKLTVVPKYNKQTIDLLQEVLTQAESGEVVEVTITSKNCHGVFDTCWTGCEDLLALVGHLERTKLIMLRRMDTGS